MLRGMNEKFCHKTVTGAEVERYIIEISGADLSKVFEQYLASTLVPVFEYKIDKGTMSYRWSNCVAGFNMPLKIITTDKDVWLNPTEIWQTMPVHSNKIIVDMNFYVVSRKM